MNFVDLIIILILILGLFTGYKRGFLPQLVSSVGFILIVIGAFLLKNPVSSALYDKLPFFPFGGVLKGVTIINIILYEVIALALVMLLLYIIYRVIFGVSKIFDKIFSMVPLFELPSKILGGILGVLENYVVVFIVLYILTLPFFNFEVLSNSKLRLPILEKTPVLSGYVDETLKASNELFMLKDKYTNSYDANEFNLEALDVLLKYNITTVSSIDKLVESNKINIANIESVLVKYRNS